MSSNNMKRDKVGPKEPEMYTELCNILRFQGMQDNNPLPITKRSASYCPNIPVWMRKKICNTKWRATQKYRHQESISELGASDQ